MDYKVECRSLWKIFGDRFEEVWDILQKDQSALSKEEALDKYGAVIGVSDVSLQVKEGELLCIMGLSGSGKSTLVRHINRLIEPTSGEVLIDGEDVAKVSNKRLREIRSKKMGMVFQNMALLPHFSVWENVALGLELRKVKEKERRLCAEKALEMMDLSGWEDEETDTLSGGMQQRVGLARAIASDPDILLMDEPFSALDPLIRSQLQEEFLNLSSKMKKTTIFITHDLDEAFFLGDRVAIMRDGQIVQIGNSEEIISNPADSYVKEFIQNVSPLRFVVASQIMRGVEEWKRVNPETAHLTATFPKATPQTILGELVDLTVETGNPTLIEDDGQIVGVVAPKDLLKGIVRP